ncbi:hypothetical protein GGR56DRAFT_503484 [Xylariaceae sp. FL0804]|nr:hypothetical protein GGR56DRAFT_503484 [Xylariaceae sp. FL0804]
MPSSRVRSSPGMGICQIPRATAWPLPLGSPFPVWVRAGVLDDLDDARPALRTWRRRWALGIHNRDWALAIKEHSPSCSRSRETSRCPEIEAQVSPHFLWQQARLCEQPRRAAGLAGLAFWQRNGALALLSPCSRPALALPSPAAETQLFSSPRQCLGWQGHALARPVWPFPFSLAENLFNRSGEATAAHAGRRGRLVFRNYRAPEL